MPTTTVVYTNRPDSMSGPLSLRRGGVSRFVLPDLQGHARQLTDSTGTVTDTLTADAWGVPKATSGSTVNPYQAFGQWGYFTDTPSRLYVRAWHLRVDVGRWVSRDPRGFEGGDWNLYGYMQNRSVRFADPSGEQYPDIPCCVDPTTGCYFCNEKGQSTGGKSCEWCCYHLQPSFPNVRKLVESGVAADPCLGSLPTKTRDLVITVLSCLARGEFHGNIACASKPGGEVLYGIFQLSREQWETCGGSGQICEPCNSIYATLNMIVAGCKHYKNGLDSALYNAFGPYGKEPGEGRNTYLACLRQNGILNESHRSVFKKIRCRKCSVLPGCPKGGY